MLHCFIQNRFGKEGNRSAACGTIITEVSLMIKTFLTIVGASVEIAGCAAICKITDFVSAVVMNLI